MDKHSIILKIVFHFGISLDEANLLYLECSNDGCLNQLIDIVSSDKEKHVHDTL